MLEVTFSNQEEGEKYVELLLKALVKVTSDARVTKYVLTKMEEILSGPDLVKRSKYFLDSSGKVDCSPFLSLLRGLKAENSDENYIGRTAGLVLASLLSVQRGELENMIALLAELLGYINVKDRRSNQKDARLPIAIQILAVSLRKDAARAMFARHGGVGLLIKLLRMQGNDASAQLLYDLVFCLWTLSLCEDVLPDFLSEGAIPILVEQVTALPREKVVRVAIATLRTLAAPSATQTTTQQGFVQEMMRAGLTKTLRHLRARNWADDDIAVDVEHLYNKLMSDYHELSTFEMYQQEVRSGQLKWGLCHTEKFWRNNVRSMEADDFALLKQLGELLGSADEEVVSIACYDIGEFVRFYPNGKSLVNQSQFNLKTKIMALIESPNTNVQRQALQAVSKIMVQKWEFVK